jgi:plasmid maintenance system antidote protein VapI
MSETEGRKVCPPDHKHGATGTCYASHFCRCDDCREGHRRSAYNLRRAKLYGRYRPPEMVAAQPVRDHVRQLNKFGIGVDRVASIAHVTEAGIRNLVYGRTGKGDPGRRRPPEQVGAELARRILAVRPETRHLAANAVVPARGVQRRLQALICLGWSQRKLAAHLDMAPAQFGKLLHRTPGVTKRMHERVSDLFDDLWDKKPPTAGRYELNAHNRARNLALANGWVPPLAWDDIDLDDAPPAVEDLVDEAAVMRAIEGEPTELTPRQRRDAVETLHARGLNDKEIAARIGCSDRTVLRIRHNELGLTANAHPRAA